MMTGHDPAGQPRICDWYFDIVSPFAYLQWKQRGRFADRLQLRPVPVVLGAILKAWEQKGPAEIAPKRLHTYRSCQWRADHLGIPLRFPPEHPFSPISGLRLIIAAGSTPEAVDRVFDAVFLEGLDLSDRQVIDQVGRALGMDDVAGRISDPMVKQALRENTDQALALGVFGVPTARVGDELFWGEDSTAMLLDYLDNPQIFETREMRRLASLPSALLRRPA
jgi:2-hydroxychromene-2-carboxylate isomerase